MRNIIFAWAFYCFHDLISIFRTNGFVLGRGFESCRLVQNDDVTDSAVGGLAERAMGQKSATERLSYSLLSVALFCLAVSGLFGRIAIVLRTLRGVS